MVVQDKKVQEFSALMASDKVKLLLLQGPPGCGKNSLIDLYCKKNNIQIIRYKEEQDSRYLHDSLDMNKDNQNYPTDLENIIHYLRVNAKGSGTGVAKASSFSTAKKKEPVKQQ